MGVKRPGLRHNANLTYSLSYAINFLKGGFGVSKREVYDLNNGKSPFTHAKSTLTKYAGVMNKFVSFLKENGINRLDKINKSHIQAFIQNRINRGFSQKTIKVDLCALEKFFNATGRTDLERHISANFQKYYSKARLPSETLPLNNPKLIIQSLRKEEFRVMAEIQYLTGARLGDIKKLKIDEEKNLVYFERSKGGRNRYIDYSDRPEKFSRIIELKKELDEKVLPRWNELRLSYPKELKYQIMKAKEVYTGTHAFRVNYAIERFEELVNRGLTELQADRILTKELGHNRIDMSRYYRNKP